MITYQGTKDFFEVSVLSEAPDRENGSMYIGLFSWPNQPFGRGCYFDVPSVWNPSTEYLPGDIIVNNIGGHGYVYECVEGGISGNDMPVFQGELGSYFFDNEVIWECVGCIFEECGDQPNSNYSRIKLFTSEWYLVDKFNSKLSYLFYIGFELNYVEPVICGYFISNVSSRGQGKLLMYEVFSDGPYSADNDVIVIRLNIPMLP